MLFCFLINETRGKSVSSQQYSTIHLLFLKLKPIHSGGRQITDEHCLQRHIIKNYPLISFNFHPSESLCNPMSFSNLLMIYFIMSPSQNEPATRSTLITVQGEFFSRGKSNGRLSRAKKFTDFQFNRRPTQRRVNLGRKEKIKTTLSNNQREKQRAELQERKKDKKRFG